MVDTVYRFRSTQSLLSKGFNELEEQVIYFASPAELNDPLEGHKKVFWRGDAIVWKNLLRHYLLCLTLKITTKIIDPNAGHASYVFHSTQELPPPMAQLFAGICHQFFLNPDLKDFPQKLADRRSAVSRHELSIYLRCTQGHALATIFKALDKEKLLSKYVKNNLEIDADLTPLNILVRSLNATEDVEKAQNAMELANIITTTEFLRLGLTHPDKLHLLEQSLASFPDDYIKELEELMHFNWYAASFVTEPDNTAMWANYADGHKGVCLKFKTKLNAQNVPAISLRRMNGWGGSKNHSGPSFAFLDHTFSEIEYRSDHVDVDFFESLGRLPRKTLEDWYRDEEGNVSTSAARILAEDSVWRDEYWNKYQISMHTKLSEWAHEKELRASFHGMALDFSDKPTRKLHYKFEDLEGIIFGLKTSKEDKLDIIKTIAAKCTKEGRAVFPFFQAYYSSITKKIAIVQLPAIIVEAV